MTRKIVLEGIDNIREFSDYPVSGGGRVRPRRLFRSAHHGKATNGDLEFLETLGLGSIVDLRRPGERARDPSRFAPSFSGEILVNDFPEKGGDEWHAHLMSSDLTVASFRAYLLDYYDRAPFNPRHLDLFARYFRTLALSDGPVLIHCAAGKDRTGILAALTLRLAGVHHDDIVEDYLLTNDEKRLDAREPEIDAMVRELTGRHPEAGALRVAMGVEPEYLDHSFQAIEREYGGVDGYFERGLKLDSEVPRAVVRRLLA